MKELKILMTGAGAPGYPSILNCIRNNGEREIYVVGVDMNPFATCRTMVDRFYVVPKASEPNFLDEIYRICQAEKIDIVLPCVTRELELFAVQKERFAVIGTKIAVMDYEPLHVANNKGLLLRTVKEAGLPTPKFQVVHTVQELKDAIEELGYPEEAVVVKPTFGNGSRGTRILDTSISRYELFFQQKPNSMYISYEELLTILDERDEIPEMMVMEYLPGKDYSVDILADHGKALYYSCRRGRAVSSIFVGSVVELNEDAIELCKEITGLLNLDGVMGFDTKENRDGQPRLMEINPRLPAGIVNSVAAGINFPYLLLKKTMGEKLPDCKVTEGVMMQLRNHEVLFHEDGTEMDWVIDKKVKRG